MHHPLAQCFSCAIAGEFILISLRLCWPLHLDSSCATSLPQFPLSVQSAAWRGGPPLAASRLVLCLFADLTYQHRLLRDVHHSYFVLTRHSVGSDPRVFQSSIVVAMCVMDFCDPARTVYGPGFAIRVGLRSLQLPVAPRGGHGLTSGKSDTGCHLQGHGGEKGGISKGRSLLYG